MIKYVTLRNLLGVSMLFAAGLSARADEDVTFQVDMSRYTNSAGAQVATVVDVRGGFNGWASGWNLVNNGANVYTNTFTVTGAAATDYAYKFTFTAPGLGLTWEDNINPPTSNDRHLILTGSPQTLPLVEFYAPSVTVPIVLNAVTFNVDMSDMTNSAGAPAYTTVSASGAFNGWAQSALVNNGANVFTNTFIVGANGNYKYTCLLNETLTWEDGSDHPITLTGAPQTLPLLKFNNSGRIPIDFVTNNITFQVDMQVQGVAFLNAGGYVSVSGGFNGWGNSAQLTNDPGLPFPQNYIYKNTFPIAYQKAYPSWPTASQYIFAYKFRANSGWEEPAVNPLFGNNDRRLSGLLAGPADTLPLVLYSDASLCDILPQDTTVTFQLRLPNGTVATDGHVFDNTVDTVHINGESLLGAWQSWNVFLPQLIRDGTSDIYTNTFLIPAGRPVAQKVKYGINGPDNEAPQYADHIQYIRTTNTTYVMSVVDFGTNYASTRVQTQWGNLAVGPSVGGNVPVTWLGCPCVNLQSRTSATSGTWTDLGNTDSASATNVPASGGEQYFRLKKRAAP